MILVCTPTGHTGRHALAGALVSRADVRVLVRNAVTDGVADRCEVIEGDGRGSRSSKRAGATGAAPSRPLACPTTLADCAQAVLKPAVGAVLADRSGAVTGYPAVIIVDAVRLGPMAY